MKFLNWWKKSELDDDLLEMERVLGQNLVPIIPRPEFIEGLRQSLVRQIPQEVELAISQQKKNLQTGLVVTGGILGGILIVLSGVRGIISLMGAVALLVNWFRQNSQQTPTAL